jgi:hypothetical protein
MAGAGSPWYVSALWPFPHIFNIVQRPEKEKAPKPEAEATLDAIGNLTSFAACFRNFLLAYFCIYTLYDDEKSPYPAFGPGKTLRLSWMLPILIRNLVGTWVICGLWDWFLYFSPLKEKLAKFKVNQQYPSWSQFKHDAAYTTLASVIATGLEVLMCWGWANEYFSFTRYVSDAPVVTLIAALTTTHWRIPHFHLMHRMMVRIRGCSGVLA